jgi:hypothetical protein
MHKSTIFIYTIKNDLLFKIKRDKGTIVPLSLFILYPICVGLDIYTTYIGDSDLSTEGNPIIRYFNMQWCSIILCSSLVVFMTIIFTHKAINYFENNREREKNKSKFWIMYLLVVWFYTHFLFELYVPINNYLSYLQISASIHNLFYNTAIKYIYWTNKVGIYIYHISTIVIALILGLLITRYKISRYVVNS